MRRQWDNLYGRKDLYFKQLENMRVNPMREL